jgi:FtsH-binding integral membrane protein
LQIIQTLTYIKSIIGGALLGTGSLFAGFTGAAMVAKKDTFLKLGGPLFGGLLALVSTIQILFVEC